MPKERPDETPQEEKGYTPASPVKRTLAWIGLAYALLFLALTTYYFYTGSMLGNLGPLLAVPGLIGLGALSLVSWRTTGRPKKGAAWLLALLCWASSQAWRRWTSSPRRLTALRRSWRSMGGCCWKKIR